MGKRADTPIIRTRLRAIPTEEYFSIVKQQLRDTGRAQVRVTGVSMEPNLHHLTDAVIILPPGRIRIGDIVLFDRQNGRYALHRVVGKGKRGFTMAGDNQWHLERHLPLSQIVGVVESIQRDGHSIPCKSFSQKFLAWRVTLFTYPRIYLRRAISLLLKPLRRGKSSSTKGNP